MGEILSVDDMGKRNFVVKIKVLQSTPYSIEVHDTWGPRYSVSKNKLTAGKFGDLNADEEPEAEEFVKDFWDNILEPKLLG